MGRAMRKRGLGFLLILTVVLAAGTLLQDYRFDRWITRERDAARTIDQQLSTIAVTLADLRAAETGYVATGQGPAFWTTRASQLLARIESDLSDRQASTASADARTHYDAAASALADLTSIDARARKDVAGNDRFEASDLIFVDALEASRRIGTELEAARTAERAASDVRVTRLGWLRLGMNAVAVVFLLAVASFFTRSAARAPAGNVPIEIEAEPAPAASSLGLSRAARTAAPEPAAAPVAAAPPGAAGVSDATWSNTAELCVDLARVVDGRDVPALVERAALVLGAKGLMLWIADARGAWLQLSLSHGYGDKVLSQLGALPADGDNATSTAFRSMRVQVVNGAAPGSPGAIAVPLVTPSGCVGVLAAELRCQQPGQEILAMARIIAAQFATLVAPSEEAARAVQA
jgi:hypothetical protein